MSSSVLREIPQNNIICSRKIDKSRKRTRNPDTHKSFQKKMKVQNGLEYKTKSGRLIKEKTFHEQTECGCKKKCATKICVERQFQIFKVFYGLENWSKKTLYLRSMLRKMPKNENLDPVTRVSRRIKKNYFLTDSSGKYEKVCRHFFLNCLQVSTFSVDRAIKSVFLNESATERRGKFPTKKTKKSEIVFLKKFIQKLPCYRSHYGTTKTNKKYLNPNLNIRRLYREYCILCDFKKRKRVSEWKFRHIFNTEFNLGFRPKKVDTCRKCDKFEAEIQSERTNTAKKECVKEQKKCHLQTVKKTKQTFDDTVKYVRNESNNAEMFTFDLQRALELPSISTSEAYYRRQLWIYNLCIFDEKRSKAFMYIWNESIASRGSQEISSCLLKHFKSHVPHKTETIYLYSDACPGQNRNIKTTLMLKKFIDSWPHDSLKSIEQRFFVSGHSYNSCDRCFGLIERQKKITEMIYTPQHWINVIDQAKKKEPKFTIIEMEKEDFFSSVQLEGAITNRKTAKNGEKVNWLNVQKIINNRADPFEMIFEEYSTLDVSPIEISLRKKSKIGRLTKFSKLKLVPLYTAQRPIKQKKYDDLMKLLEFIPDKFREFYKNLKSDGKNETKRKRAKVLFYSSEEEN